MNNRFPCKHVLFLRDLYGLPLLEVSLVNTRWLRDPNITEDSEHDVLAVIRVFYLKGMFQLLSVLMILTSCL